MDYRIAAWRFPNSRGTPQIIQVMDDNFSIETHGDMVISFFINPPHDLKWKPQGAMAGSLRWVCIPSGIVERHKAHGIAELFEIFAICNR